MKGRPQGVAALKAEVKRLEAEVARLRDDIAEAHRAFWNVGYNHRSVGADCGCYACVDVRNALRQP